MSRPKGSKNKKKEVVSTPVAPLYSITIKIGNQEYRGEGATALDAIQALPKSPKTFLKGIVTFAHGQKSRELLMMPPKIKRLYYPMAQKVFAKTLFFGLN